MGGPLAGEPATDQAGGRHRVAEIWLHDGYMTARKQKAQREGQAKCLFIWLRGQDLNLRPSGCEADKAIFELSKSTTWNACQTRNESIQGRV
jgi:hypothetical protein